MFHAEERMGATGGPLISQGQRAAVENAYNKKAEQLLTDENCFKILICQKNGQLHLGIVLLDTDEDQEEDVELSTFAKWSQYVDHYAQDKLEITPDIKSGLEKRAVFLQRNSKILKMRPRIENEEGELREGSLAKTNNIEIKFAPNSYKIKYVPGTEDVTYRIGSNKSSKKVSSAVIKKLHDKFKIWHTNWERENISRDMSRQANNWLMGKIEDMSSSVTICRIEKVGVVSKNMYTVQYGDQNDDE